MAWGRYHWSNSASRPKLYMIDAKAAIPLFILSLFPSWTTLWVALSVLSFYLFLEFKMGMTDRVFLRYLIVKAIGSERKTK